MAGFRSDLASIPWWLPFGSLLFPSNGAHQRWAVGHDHLYRRQPFGVRRVEADAAFFSGMQDDGVPTWRAFAMYAAVRLFGWISWNQNRRLLADNPHA